MFSSMAIVHRVPKASDGCFQARTSDVLEGTYLYVFMWKDWVSKVIFAYKGGEYQGNIHKIWSFLCKVGLIWE